jgi:tetratricopeptide (TPR) repeat protein
MEEIVVSVAAGLGGTILGGILEGVSDRKFCDQLKGFQDNLRLHQPEVNHDIAKAIYRSYLQATLQSCALRGEQLGVDVSHCVLKESFQQALTRLIESSPALEYSFHRTKLQGRQVLDSLKRLANRQLKQLPSAQTEEERLAIEIHWLDQVATATRQKIKDLDSGKIRFKNFDFANQLELLVQPDYPTAADRVKAIRAQLLQRVLSEISSEFSEPPVEFAGMLSDGWTNEVGIHQDWFTLFCACFQHQLKHDPGAQAAFQNDILAQLKIDGQAVSPEAAMWQLEVIGGELCQKLDDVRDALLRRADESDTLTQARFDELLPLIAPMRDIHTTIKQLLALIWQEDVKTRDAVDRKGDEVIEAVYSVSEENKAAIKEANERLIVEIEQRLTARIVRPVRQPLVGLPDPTLKVAGRDAEISELRKELQNPDGRRVLPIIAPSGYGKTSLVTKFLSTVTNGQQITIPDAQAIVFIRCRENASLAELLSDFESITGAQELQQLYQATKTTNGSLSRLARNVLAYLSQIGAVWIVLDNFESWLGQEQRISSDELRAWVETALESSHSVRLILTSQFMPQLSAPRLQNRLKQMTAIEEPLENGLPETHALPYLRQEGSECGLDRADETLLKEFLQKTHYIPSAMESLIGHLNEVYPETTFEKLMRDKKAQAAFQSHDRAAGGQYLIGLQLAALSPDALRVLSALAFFGSDTPSEALNPLALADRLPTILNRLGKNRLLRFERDVFGVIRYTVQPYIAQNEELQKASLSSEYADDLISLGVQAGEKAYHRLDRDFQKCAEATYRALIDEGRAELRHDLAGAVMNKGNALMNLNDLAAAITCYDEAIETYRALIDEGRAELRHDLAGALANKGLALWAQEDYDSAYSHLNEAVSLVEECVKAGQEQFRRLLDKVTGWRDEVRKLMSSEP